MLNAPLHFVPGYQLPKLFSFAAICVALAGIALAQSEASGSVFLVDFDPARYNSPVSQRVALRVGDQPRNITIGTQDEICVQLHRVGDGANVVSARVRALRPEQRPTVEVRLIAPDISPGTFRSTPWGLLLRAVPENSEHGGLGKAQTADDAAVCAL